MWLSLIAAVLWATAGLRDIFAPGFFTISPRNMGKLDIALEFATAAIFLFVAVVFGRKRWQSAGQD
jgi:hypothetical protein